jgi:hypothetical protein
MQLTAGRADAEHMVTKTFNSQQRSPSPAVAELESH